MTKQYSENNGHKDAVSVKKDISALLENSAARLTKLEDEVSQAAGKAKEDLTTWVEGGVSQVNEGLEKLSDDARETVVGAATTVKKEVGHGLSQYNTKAQEFADKVPGGFGMKTARYPWVVISIALLFGIVLGMMLKSVQHLLA
jgi:hypothetical protein